MEKDTKEVEAFERDNVINSIDTLANLLTITKPEGMSSYSCVWADDEIQNIKDKIGELIIKL